MRPGQGGLHCGSWPRATACQEVLQALRPQSRPGHDSKRSKAGAMTLLRLVKL